MDLLQSEVDHLLAVEKHYFGNERYSYPDTGGALHIQLHSPDKKEEFLLDIRRSSITLNNTFQNRARKCIVLCRLELAGPPHINPDGQEMGCPHIHLYKEGYGDKWAYPLPDFFTNVGDVFLTLHEFMEYCHITKQPTISKGLLT